MGIRPKGLKWIQQWIFGRFELTTFPDQTGLRPDPNTMQSTQQELDHWGLAWLVLEASVSWGVGKTGKTHPPMETKGITAGNHLSPPLAGEGPCTAVDE